MNARSKTNLVANWCWKGLFSGVLILTIVTSFFAQTPPLRANGKIAFTSDRDGNPEIYVMDADGTNQIRLTNNAVVDDDPTWSPDGTKIAFVSEQPTGGFAIFVMNADGTNKTEITSITFDPLDAWSMSWSPEGDRIVFQDPSAFPSDIHLVNKDGSNRHVLINGPEDQLMPSWSPDGSRILFSKQVSQFFYNLFTVKPDGTDLRALGHSIDVPETDFAPTWSPTGDRIALQTFDFANTWNISVANADGSNRFWFDQGDITGPDEGARFKPDWSPDGSKIIFFVSDFPAKGSQIYVKNVDGTGLTKLTNLPGNNFNPSWQSLAPATCLNPIDCADSFVRQHYRDFLSREPDSPGLAFWTNEIMSCGSDLHCVEVKRVNVSAAFFLSIEFQEGGYLVYRFYKSAFGNLAGAPVPITLNDFLPDAQQIGQGLVVGQPGWQTLLENNKQAYALAFVQRSQFTPLYQTSMSPAAFVDTLFANAGVIPTSEERAVAINEFGGASTTIDVAARARVLRRVAENSTLAQQEFNRAFVLMQYFGYLRRNPNDLPDVNFDGYNFWLNKLDQFNGNFIQAEMVKGFLSSIEYRSRFGP